MHAAFNAIVDNIVIELEPKSSPELLFEFIDNLEQPIDENIYIV